MRSAALTTIKGGIDRLRTKGGARADSLYDLVNGRLTEARTVVARPGTTRTFTLDPDFTAGLVYFDGGYHTFSWLTTSVPSGVTLHVLLHPDATPSNEIAIRKIHFAAPFMGALYVVAEFVDDSVHHYWLQEATTWEANKVYTYGALVEPAVKNGLVYRATRIGPPNPSWAPGVQRSDGVSGPYEQSVIEPTVYNDYYYSCIDTQGSNPVSGQTEPTWPTSPGATVIEDTEAAASSEPSVTEPPSADALPADLAARYNFGNWSVP